MANLRNEVLDFYSRFSEYADMSSISYLQRNNDDRSRALRQIKAGEVSIVKKHVEIPQDEDYKEEDLPSEYNLNINLKNQTVGFLEKKVSPIVKAKNGDTFEDTHKLYIAFAFMKVFFEEKDTNAYFPLIMLDVTEHKDAIYKGARKTGSYDLEVNFKKDLVINEEVANFFFDISFEENGESYSEYIAANLEDFIPEDNRGSIKEVTDYTYSFFKDHAKSENLEVIFPAITSNKSSAFMFFSSQANFKKRQEYSLIQKEDAPLVTDYLEFTQEENKAPELDDTVWYGSLTRDFPLGKGQAIVLQECQNDKQMIPVVGGPGTGKTTLFLSLISNIVTKRAFSNIYDNTDYNNMILVTSTSNKAVENVYKSLQNGFKHGFCYVGGNSANRIESAKEVSEFIQILEKEEFSEAKLEKYEASVKRIKNYIDKLEIAFNEIHINKPMLARHNVKSFKSLADAEELLLNQTESMKEESISIEIAEFNKLFQKLKVLLDIDNLDLDKVLSWFNGDVYTKLEIAKEKIEGIGFFSKIFKSEEALLAELDLEFIIKDSSSLVMVIDLINRIAVNKDFIKEAQEKEAYFRDLKILSMFSVKYADKKKQFDKMIKEEVFGEYFRLNLFSLNYKLYLQAYNYLYQKMLSEKDDVIRAITYLAEPDNQFQYLIDNFGSSKEGLTEFLRLVSLAYPVSTSTLAAIGSMFPGVFPNKVPTYQNILADEAGMIAVNDLVPALRRAERAIVVGDPKQLAPIVSMEETFLDSLKSEFETKFWEKYSPSCVSAFHRSAGTIVGGYKATGRGIVLDEHRRCSPQIAKLFIKVAEYEGLNVCTPTPKGKAFKNIKEQGLMFFDIKNPDQTNYKKVNTGEMDVIEKLLIKLEKAGYNLKKDVGIITPYKDQEVSLIKRFGATIDHNPNEEAKIGTVHKFQGVEYKVVIFSSVISREHDSLSFVNVDPSLINVAISRSKECFIAVGDFDKLTKDKKKENYIGVMSEYMKKHGTYTKMKSK